MNLRQRRGLLSTAPPRIVTAGDRKWPRYWNSHSYESQISLPAIELTTQPVAATRFVWIEVLVPDNDDVNSAFTQNGTSGLIGYRVFRN